MDCVVSWNWNKSRSFCLQYINKRGQYITLYIRSSLRISINSALSLQKTLSHTHSKMIRKICLESKNFLSCYIFIQLSWTLSCFWWAHQYAKHVYRANIVCYLYYSHFYRDLIIWFRDWKVQQQTRKGDLGLYTFHALFIHCCSLLL